MQGSSLLQVIRHLIVAGKQLIRNRVAGAVAAGLEKTMLARHRVGR
jgi:hypothetical protein